MSEFMSASGEGAQVAAGLRERSARMAAAAVAAEAVSYEAASDAGRPSEVSVTAAGTGMVSRIYVGPRAMHSAADGLADTLARLVNEGVSGARQRASRALQAALAEAGEQELAAAVQEGMSAAEELAVQLTGQTVSATSPGQKVTVTANGAGEITEVEFATTALRGDDNLTLAGEIAAAVNAALGAVRHLQDTVTGAVPEGAGPAGGKELADVLHERVSAFNRQMGELDHRLDEVIKELGNPA